ncbi:MAG: diaminobutyrate--2-oxoglutarate transaminase, partial [Anderseniella sp.]|nr:diaminobutyrate--2-oxoglutarate transaminase [Anderseniella sp.]
MWKSKCGSPENRQVPGKLEKVYICEVRPFVWSVRDDRNAHGGLFRTKLDAYRFVRLEFPVDTEIIQSRNTPIAPRSGHRSKRSDRSRDAVSNRQCHLIQRDISPRRPAVHKDNTTAPTPQADIFALKESSVQSYARAFPLLCNQARGAVIWDKDGRRYLDFLAGAGSLNYGHNNPVLKQALLDYITDDGITHSLDLHTCAKEKFLRSFNDAILEPLGLDYKVQFTGPTGTNAVEAAIKIARKVTGRSTVISFTNGFHGVSMGSLALTGNSHFRGAAGLPLQGAVSMPYDNYMGPETDTLDYMEAMLGDPASGLDHPAAVIVETVQGEGGINTASAAWLRRLETICKRNKILLIVDDIQAGCGRTGSFFSFTEAGIVPDIVTLSKSISGYGLPMAVVLLKPEHDQWKPAEHNGTFRGNNHAFVTAAAALDHYWRTDEFADAIAAKAQVLDKRLQKIMKLYPREVVELRGRGMMRGICCKHPKKAAAITAQAFKNGAIFERAGSHDEVIKFLMPLTIEIAELNEGLDIL